MKDSTTMTVREAVDYIHQTYVTGHFSERTVSRWAQIGHVTATRTAAGHYRIPQSEVDRLFVIQPANAPRKAS